MLESTKRLFKMAIRISNTIKIKKAKVGEKRYTNLPTLAELKAKHGNYIPPTHNIYTTPIKQPIIIKKSKSSKQSTPKPVSKEKLLKKEAFDQIYKANGGTTWDIKQQTKDISEVPLQKIKPKENTNTPRYN